MMKGCAFVLALIAAGFAYVFSGASGATPRAGMWDTKVALADFAVQGLAAQSHEQIRDDLLSDWGLRDESGLHERACLSDGDIRELTSIADRPRPQGWSKDECAFTRNGNKAGTVDVGGRCAKADGSMTLDFDVAGATEREKLGMDIALDYGFSGGGMTADARLKLRVDATYVGPCEKDGTSLSEIIGA